VIIFEFFDGWIDNASYFELFDYFVVIPIHGPLFSFLTSIMSFAALKYAS